MIVERKITTVVKQDTGFQTIFGTQIADCSRKFRDLLDRIRLIAWKSSIQMCLKSYNFQIFELQELTLEGVWVLYEKISLKYYKMVINGLGQRIQWLQNQLKLFAWLLAATPPLFKKQLIDYGQAQLLQLAEVFFAIRPDLCDYQIRIITTTQALTEWATEESHLLSKLIEKHNFEGSWTIIARQLYLDSNKLYFKTAHACRQKWKNHLNAHLVKGQWTTQEDYTIMKNVIVLGKRWSIIAKKLGITRTQHMVKNRFLTIIKRDSRKKQFKKAQQTSILVDIQRKLFQRLGQQKTNSYKAGLVPTINLKLPLISGNNQKTQENIGYQFHQSNTEEDPFKVSNIILDTDDSGLLELISLPSFLGQSPCEIIPILIEEALEKDKEIEHDLMAEEHPPYHF